MEVGELRMGEDGNNTSAAWSSPEFEARPGTMSDSLRRRLDELPVGAGAAESCVASGLTVLGTADPTGSRREAGVLALGSCTKPVWNEPDGREKEPSPHASPTARRSASNHRPPGNRAGSCRPL